MAHNAPIVRVLSFEVLPEPQPTSIRNHSLMETSILQPHMESFWYFDLRPYKTNEGALDKMGDWEAGTTDLTLFDRQDTSGSELN